MIPEALKREFRRVALSAVERGVITIRIEARPERREAMSDSDHRRIQRLCMQRLREKRRKVWSRQGNWFRGERTRDE